MTIVFIAIVISTALSVWGAWPDLRQRKARHRYAMRIGSILNMLAVLALFVGSARGCL